jgi:hypothetical protein
MFQEPSPALARFRKAAKSFSCLPNRLRTAACRASLLVAETSAVTRHVDFSMFNPHSASLMCMSPCAFPLLSDFTLQAWCNCTTYDSKTYVHHPNDRRHLCVCSMRSDVRFCARCYREMQRCSNDGADVSGKRLFRPL